MRTTTTTARKTTTIPPSKVSASTHLIEKMDELLGGVHGDNPFKSQDHIHTCMLDILECKLTDHDDIFQFPNIDINKRQDEFYRDYLERLRSHIQSIEDETRKIDEIGKKIQNILMYLRQLSRLLEFSELNIQFIEFIGKFVESINQKKVCLLKLYTSLCEEHDHISGALSDKEENEDTITVKLFYKNHADRDKEILSIPSEGHVALIVKSADGSREHYVSLYPDHHSQPIDAAGMIASSITAQLGMPKTTVKAGKLVGPESDNSGFRVQSSVTIPCREPLDFNKVAAWAHSLLTTYKNSAGAPKLRYQFYGQGGYSCSSLVLEGLKNANVEAVLPYQGNFTGVVNPKSVFEYARFLEAALHAQKLEQQMKEGVRYSQEQYLCAMLELTARKIQSYVYILSIKLNRENKLNIYDDSIQYIIYVYKMLLDLSDRIKMGKSLDKIKKIAGDFLEDSIKRLGNDAELGFDEVLSYLTPMQHFIEKPYILAKLNAYHFESTLASSIINNTQYLTEVLDVYHIFDRCLNVGKKKLKPQDSFGQNVSIQEAIKEIQGLKRILNPNDHKDLICFYNEAIFKLKITQGLNNQFIYFDQYKDIADSHNNHLLSLKNVISPHNQDMSDLGEYTENQIQSLAPAHVGNIEIPSIFNPFTWRERWKMLENRAQNMVHRLVASEKIGLNKKLEYIEQCIDDYRPSWWEFWRSKDESSRYATLEQKAKLLCIFKSFNNGDIDVIDLVNKLRVLAKTTSTGQVDDIKKIADGIFESFKNNARGGNTASFIKLFQDELNHTKNMMTRAFPKRPPCENPRLSKAYHLLFHQKSQQLNKVDDVIDLTRKVRMKLG